MAKGKKTGGRKSGYVADVLDAVLDEFAAGATLTSVLDKYSVPRGNFFQWVFENRDNLIDRYNRARLSNAYAKMDEAERIAEDGTNDFVEVETRNGSFVKLREEHVRRSDLRVRFRMWYCEKVLNGALLYKKPETEVDNSFAISSDAVALLEEIAAHKAAKAKGTVSNVADG